MQQIRAMVLSGDLTPEAGLPSIRAFARDCQVSVITVQRAYETLGRLGLIHSRRGKGFFVSAHPAEELITLAAEHLQSALTPPVEQALAEGLTSADVKRSLAAVLDQLIEKREQAS